MTALDYYIIDCLSTGKRISGRKVSLLGPDKLPDDQLFCIANNIDQPSCSTCGINPVALISLNRGFRKYCSRQCYRSAMSERNMLTNISRNPSVAKNRGEDLSVVTRQAVEHYLNSPTSTISQAASIHNVSFDRLRRALHIHYGAKSIPKERRNSAWRNTACKSMESVDMYADDAKWIEAQQRRGYTASIVAKHLGCSPNYIATKARELGVGFPNSKTISSHEIILMEYLASMGLDVISNDRRSLDGMEIDLLIAQHTIGIEINGVYWHQYTGNPDHGKRYNDTNYHKAKTDVAESKQINLLQIFDYEFNDPDKLKIIKSIILGRCGADRTVDANHCTIKLIDSEIYNTFMATHHIEGAAPSEISLGLYDNNVIVAAIGLNVHEDRWQVVRVTDAMGISVIGGTNALLEYFADQFKAPCVTLPINRRFSQGDGDMQMSKVSTEPPRSQWIKYSGKTLDIVTETLTDAGVMRMNKYMKVYDCGHDIYHWHTRKELD